MAAMKIDSKKLLATICRKTWKIWQIETQFFWIAFQWIVTEHIKIPNVKQTIAESEKKQKFKYEH